MERKIKVHIADDHQILIEGVIALINTEKDIEVTGYSLTGKQVIEWSKTNTADVLVLDINMPKVDGIEVLKIFQARNIKQKTIILSSLNDPKLVQELLKLGANGYIEKGVASDSLIEAIRKVHSNQQYLSKEVKEKLFEMYMNTTNSELEQYTVEKLTERDIELLQLVAQEKDTAEIAAIMNITNRTVENYRSKLIKKLNVKNAVGLAMYAVKNNMV